MFDISDTDFPGLLQITPKPYNDQRGKFIKTFHQSSFAKLGIETYFKEQYYSVSYKNVIRGMHFQMSKANIILEVYILMMCTIVHCIKNKQGFYLEKNLE